MTGSRSLKGFSLSTAVEMMKNTFFDPSTAVEIANNTFFVLSTAVEAVKNTFFVLSTTVETRKIHFCNFQPRLKRKIIKKCRSSVEKGDFKTMTNCRSVSSFFTIKE